MQTPHSGRRETTRTRSASGGRTAPRLPAVMAAVTALAAPLALGVFAVLGVALPASAQSSSISVQCPPTTGLHPSGGAGIKCGHLVAGDGMVKMADSKELYIFGFAMLPGGGPAVNSAEYPGWVMTEGTLAANAPAPTIAVDEDDELFLTPHQRRHGDAARSVRSPQHPLARLPAGGVDLRRRS